MNAFRFVCAPVVLLTLFLSGCSSAGVSAVESISVRLLDLKPGNPAVMRISFINASVLPIAVSSANHKLYVNGRKVGEIEEAPAIGLPAAGTAEQELTLTLTDDLAGLSGSVPYRLDTTITVLAGEDRLRSRTRAEGVVTLP